MKNSLCWELIVLVQVVIHLKVTINWRVVLPLLYVWFGTWMSSIICWGILIPVECLENYVKSHCVGTMRLISVVATSSTSIFVSLHNCILARQCTLWFPCLNCSNIVGCGPWKVDLEPKALEDQAYLFSWGFELQSHAFTLISRSVLGLNLRPLKMGDLRSAVSLGLYLSPSPFLFGCGCIAKAIGLAVRLNFKITKVVIVFLTQSLIFISFSLNISLKSNSNFFKPSLIS